MDRFTRTADIIKAYYSYKQTADSATFVKKCAVSLTLSRTKVCLMLI